MVNIRILDKEKCDIEYLLKGIQIAKFGKLTEKIKL